MYIVLSFFILAFIVLIHEFGHFIMAKACKIEVEEFAIGFGLKILSFKFKKTVYSFRLIPFGGFCEFNEQSFKDSALWQKVLTILAGPVANLILAVFVLVVYSVAFLGNGFVASFVNSIYATLLAFVVIFQTIFGVAETAESSIVGPVGIIELVASSVSSGALEVIMLMFAINISLFIMNMLPLPILDGGRLVMLGIENIMNKPISQKIEELLMNISVALLVILVVFVTYFDLSRLLS